MAEDRNELTPVRCGCGGQAVIYVTHWWGQCYVCECEECGTASRPCTTEAEAITAWNTAMGVVAKNATTERSAQECAKDARCKERTAKATAFDPDSKGFWATDGRCEGCGSYLERKYDYCPGCGARLEWK